MAGTFLFFLLSKRFSFHHRLSDLAEESRLPGNAKFWKASYRWPLAPVFAYIHSESVTVHLWAVQSAATVALLSICRVFMTDRLLKDSRVISESWLFPGSVFHNKHNCMYVLCKKSLTKRYLLFLVLFDFVPTISGIFVYCFQRLLYNSAFNIFFAAKESLYHGMVV